MEFSTEAIIDRIEELEFINNAIDVVLESNFNFVKEKKVKVKRGIVHSLITDRLGLILNNSTCLLIRARIVAKGGIPYMLHGKHYYKFVEMKE